MRWDEFVAPGRTRPDEPDEGDVFYGATPITPGDERRPGDPRPCRCGSGVLLILEPILDARTGRRGIRKTMRRVPGTARRAFVQAGGRQYCELCGVHGGDPDADTLRADPDAVVLEGDDDDD